MTTYYIDNSSANANDNNAGTSQAAPRKTLAGVQSLHLKPGDTVQFKAGTTYTGSVADDAVFVIKASGTAAAPITFTTYGIGNPAIFNNTNSSQNSRGIAVTGSYIILKTLIVHQAQEAAFFLDPSSSHVTVTNCRAANTGFGIYAYGDNQIITHNYFHDLHSVYNPPVSVDATGGYGAVGIAINGNGDDVGFNRLINCSAPSFDFGHDGGGVETWGNVTGLNVHDNWVQGSQGFFESGGGDLKNVTLKNNVSLNNGMGFWLHNSGEFGGSYSNVVASNNTFVEQSYKPDQGNTVGSDSPLNSSEFSFKNNIVSLNNGASVYSDNSLDHAHNVILLTGGSNLSDTGAGLSGGDVFADPAFKNVAAFDFTPTATNMAGEGARLLVGSTGFT